MPGLYVHIHVSLYKNYGSTVSGLNGQEPVAYCEVSSSMMNASAWLSVRITFALVQGRLDNAISALQFATP